MVFRQLRANKSHSINKNERQVGAVYPALSKDSRNKNLVAEILSAAIRCGNWMFINQSTYKYFRPSSRKSIAITKSSMYPHAAKPSIAVPER